MMNIRYPVRKADGRDYKNYDELLTDIRKNTHGWWLLGVNRYWHGGIHVGTSSSPASVLNQETPEKSVPLQFMMDGEVVAWRVNRDYAAIECYQERPLRQSGTFVLVKSVYKPDEQDESSWLTLYQLYMHIAPLSEFPKRPLYRVTQKGHGVRMRKYSRHDDSREIAPDVQANKHGHPRTLTQGDTLAVLQQRAFLLEQRPEPFALVQRLQDGKPAGELFWVSMRPEYLEPDGQCYVCLPDWMHSALNHGVFDDVVVPPVPLKVMVKAGDAVGFLGAQDLADEDNYPQIITTDYKAHIELLSLDEHVPDVVANIKGIKTGKQFIKLKLKRPLYLRNGEGEESTFEQMSAITRVDAGKIIPRDATYPFTDKTGVTYFQIRPHTWMHQNDVEQLSQHDLAGLNFHCIEAEHTTDFTRTLDERWLIDALKSIRSHFDGEKGPQFAQAKMFYDSLIHNAENRRPPTPYPDKSLDQYLFGALHTNQMNIPEYARRLIVKHDSSWHSTRDDTRWSSVCKSRDESPVVKMANGGFLDATHWMDKVPPFASQRSVWHFHPLEFPEILRSAEFPRTPINGVLTSIEFIHFYNGDKIDDTDYEEAAKELGCEVAAIKAVAKTETGSYGSYFKFEDNDDYVPAILFERHHFHKYTNGKYDQFEDISNPVAGGYGATSIQYAKLVKAYTLDKKAALKSASWGKFQILASNYATAGYASPEDFVFALSKSEKNQLKAFVSFIKADRVLLHSIRTKDWLSFAQRYNGPRQKGYDLKMERNYNASL
ncbi:N-acetylmuramidase family protein [Escherichia coli]|uniref:N-acetylmuramidase family protein n=1 Tax=Escherichia coli TaxID=562 RepID=UPI0017979AC6|nr:N-acetylmuramidase family protein [Escherichia coli]EFC4831902.1 N-acetylmuramidase family protein [Escherichia coli]EHY5882087.1 N-acetylmuramidase family protein [Escherichia coli]MBN6395607.1 N-acetylmuramidase family protein [Escherichia coli]